MVLQRFTVLGNRALCNMPPSRLHCIPSTLQFPLEPLSTKSSCVATRAAGDTATAGDRFRGANPMMQVSLIHRID